MGKQITFGMMNECSETNRKEIKFVMIFVYPGM